MTVLTLRLSCCLCTLAPRQCDATALETVDIVWRVYEVRCQKSSATYGALSSACARLVRLSSGADKATASLKLSAVEDHVCALGRRVAALESLDRALWCRLEVPSPRRLLKDWIKRDSSLGDLLQEGLLADEWSLLATSGKSSFQGSMPAASSILSRLSR